MKFIITSAPLPNYYYYSYKFQICSYIENYKTGIILRTVANF